MWGWHEVCFCLSGKLGCPVVDTAYHGGVIMTPYIIPTHVKGAVERAWYCNPLETYSEPRRR
jgi:hypothetical protein